MDIKEVKEIFSRNNEKEIKKIKKDELIIAVSDLVLENQEILDSMESRLKILQEQCSEKDEMLEEWANTFESGHSMWTKALGLVEKKNEFLYWLLGGAVLVITVLSILIIIK